MQNIKKFLKLSFRKKLMLISLFITLGVMRLFVLIIPFRKLAIIMGNRMDESQTEVSSDKISKILDIKNYINVLSKHTPWKSECFVQALTGQLFLRLYKVTSTIYLGIAKEDDKLIAHAWLRCGPIYVSGGEMRNKFKVVATFAVH